MLLGALDVSCHISISHLGADIHLLASDSFVPPIIGGLLIGLSQLASLLLTTNTLAVSSAYEEVGDYFWWILSAFTAGTLKPKAKPAPHDVNSTIFAVSLVPKSCSLMLYLIWTNIKLL